jgi:hypothetical protein
MNNGIGMSSEEGLEPIPIRKGRTASSVTELNNKGITNTIEIVNYNYSYVCILSFLSPYSSTFSSNEAVWSYKL